jgi:hypothetical protein
MRYNQPRWGALKDFRILIQVAFNIAFAFAYITAAVVGGLFSKTFKDNFYKEL